MVNLQQLVIGARLGVLSLIKRIRGRDITEEQSLDDGTVRLLLGDGNAITTSPEALEGYRRLTIRRSSERIVRPLREGVDDIGFVETVSEEATVELVREDLAAFEPPAPDAAEQLSSTREAVVEVRSSVFDGNKWRVHDGESSFYVDIEDRSFLRRVEAGEHFAAGDQLRVDLRTDQVTRLDGTLSTQHAIVAVHEHRHRPEPPPRLDFGEA